MTAAAATRASRNAAGAARRGDRVPVEYGIDLYWLPLGAGGRSVRLNGRVFEALVARREGRRALALYHSALEVVVPAGRFVIETAPALSMAADADRGVVGEGPVGSRAAGRLRLFRYELRCWRDGVIPDVDEAVASPRRVSEDPDQAARLLALVPRVPLPVWGRDELRAGEMWNSNSVVSWLLASSGVPVDGIRPPLGGRAPGWDAGIVVARRDPDRSQGGRSRAPARRRPLRGHSQVSSVSSRSMRTPPSSRASSR